MTGTGASHRVALGGWLLNRAAGLNAAVDQATSPLQFGFVYRSASRPRASASWMRNGTPSFLNAFPGWYATVLGLRNKRVPISGLVSPSGASRAICSSRAVRSRPGLRSSRNRLDHGA